MTTTGPNSGGTFANDTTVGTTNWTSPSNAASSNNSKADSGSLTTQSTYYLKATNFGFSITGTIDGITVEIERMCSSFGGQKMRDNSLKLVVGGSIVGTDKAATSTDWPTSDTYATYGGAADLWGLTPTDTEVSASDFGVAISGKAFNFGKGTVIGEIDHIRITITYTAAGGPTVKTLAALGVG